MNLIKVTGKGNINDYAVEFKKAVLISCRLTTQALRPNQVLMIWVNSFDVVCWIEDGNARQAKKGASELPAYTLIIFCSEYEEEQ